MKFSLNTILDINKRYGCADDVAAIGVESLIDKIGSQLGGIEEVASIGEKYQGVIVAKIVDCQPHPDADRLKVCFIDEGGVADNVERNEAGQVQVICGAPNARAGIFVAWLAPGVTVPETYNNGPFVLEARELRGQLSNGMLASPRELALGDSHDGILELDGDYKPGQDFAEALDLKDDVLIDVENKMFTHRPDCFGYLGISRELAGIQGLPFKSPEWYKPNADFPAIETEPLRLSVKNEIPDLVPRFSVIAMSNFKLGPSPTWLQVALAKVGQKSINNIVDFTNFYMLETGQPLHAFDYDKVKAKSSGDGANIVVRHPKPGEKILLLNGKEVEPPTSSMMIATDQELISLGGAMGGEQTEVDETTKNIILECANFDMYTIRRTAMALGIFTEAVTRFTKGQSPLQTTAVLSKVVGDIRQFAEGKVASEIIDDNHLSDSVKSEQSLFPSVSVTPEFINARLGLSLSSQDVKTLLTNVEFNVEAAGEELVVKAPFWRTDIEQPEDIVEEVGRLYGYDHLPMELPTRAIQPTAKTPSFSLKTAIRANLSRAGASEVLTYSFVHGDLLKKVGQNPELAYALSKALSPELQYYRLSLTPSLLDKVHANIKAGHKAFALFELGKAHQVDKQVDGLPEQLSRLAFVISSAQSQGTAYYQALKYLRALIDGLAASSTLEIKPIEQNSNDQSAMYYAVGRSAAVYLDGKALGYIGEYSASVRRQLKLPEYCAGFEIDTDVLVKQNSNDPYEPLSKFPSVTQDITLKVDTSLSYQTLVSFSEESLAKLQPENSLFTLEPVDIYQGEDKASKNVTLRLELTNYDRTLTDSEVNKLLDEVALAAKSELQAERI